MQVYLDQLHWVFLARAATDHPLGRRFKGIYELVGRAVDTGCASFPISSSHYYENHKQHDVRRRHHLASVMGGISQFRTIAGVSEILPGELDAALAARFGKPEVARPIVPFGSGAEHAFGAPRSVLPMPADFDPESSDSLYRAIQLAMLGGDTTALGITPSQLPSTFGLFDEYFRSSRQGLNDLVLAGRIARRDVEDEVVAGVLLAMFGSVREALLRAGVRWSDFEALGEVGWWEFVHDLPTRDVEVKLLQQRHKNPQKVWDGHDLSDVSALAIAVPYCDVVVTERFWADLLKRAKLDEKYNTVVLADLADLSDLLQRRVDAARSGVETRSLRHRPSVI